MSETQSCLSKKVLDQIGRDEIFPYELRAIEEHVSKCERCRSLFTEAVVEPAWAETILPVLRDQNRDLTGACNEATIAEADPWTGSEAALKLLGPSDDPRMLGRIGPYEVTGIIGRGGMGLVFKAFDAPLNRFVAIKMLLPHLASSGSARRRFSREGQAAAAVIDDHVLPIFGVNEWQGVPYIVSQYSSGMSLHKRIHEQGRLEVKEILRIGLQVARGLAAAHAQGLVHRDVKPSNILLDRTVERALLTDFGLARAVDDATITRSGTIAGTPQFMAPEQARGESVDQRSDLFSLGSVMYAMCTGRPPFRADNSYGVIRRITDEEPHPIREINGEIPDWLSGIVRRLMAKRPQDRFDSASKVAELLEQCLAHVQQPASVPLPSQIAMPVTEKLPSSRLSFKAKVISLTAIVGTLMAVAFAQQTGDKRQNSRDTDVAAQPVRTPIEVTNDEAGKQQNGERDLPAAESVATINGQLAGLPERVQHDFAEAALPPDRFDVRGRDLSKRVETTPDGIQVSHPGQPGYSSTSIESRLLVGGNFEVTAYYENFYFDAGEDGSGAISLTAILDNDAHTHCSIQRGARIDPGNPIWHFVQTEFVHSPQREPGVVWLGTGQEEATSGRLRLARIGDELHCLFAAGDSPEYRLIHTETVGSEDTLFGGIRLNTGVQSNASEHGAGSVTWKELTIRAERITDWSGEDGVVPEVSSSDVGQSQ